MAGDSDLEKTESATPRRREKALEEGQIVRSRELTTFALLSAGFFGVWGMSGSSVCRGRGRDDRLATGSYKR